MIKWTTPIQKIRCRNVDLTDSKLYITIVQGKTIMTLSDDILVSYDGNDSLITFKFTQDMYANLKPGVIKLQLNYMTLSGDRFAADPLTLTITANLLDEKIDQ